MSDGSANQNKPVKYLGYSIDGKSYQPPRASNGPSPLSPTARLRLPASIVTAALILIGAGVATARHPKIGPPDVGSDTAAFDLLHRGVPLEIKAGPLIVLISQSPSGNRMTAQYLGNSLGGKGRASWGRNLQTWAAPNGGGSMTSRSVMPGPSVPVKVALTKGGVTHYERIPLARSYALIPHNGPRFQGQRDGLLVTFVEITRHGPAVGMWSGTLKVSAKRGSVPAHLRYALLLHGGAAGGTVPTGSHMVRVPISENQPTPPGVNPAHPRLTLRWKRHYVPVPLHRV